MQRRKSTFLVFLTLFLVVAASSIVVTHPEQPPAGKTGAPGEFTCGESTCHNVTPTVTSDILFNTAPAGGFTNGYTPGQLYNITINVGSPNLFTPSTTQPRDGFEVTALDASDNRAGTFSLTTPNSTTLDSTFGRQYVGHKDANSTSAWVFKWTAPAAGTGTVKFYVAANRSNNNDLSTGDNIYTQVFTVNEGTVNPCTGFNAFITTPGNATSFCAGQSLTLTAGSSGGTGTATYNWSNGAGTNQDATVNTAGTYTVTVTKGGCTATASLNVTSIAAGAPAFSASVTDNVVTINNNSTGVNGNYTWDFGDGSTPFADNSASFSYTYDSIGTFSITITYTDVCGVQRTTNRPVTITAITGVAQLTLAEVLSIYPNPFGNQANINVNGFNGSTYQLTLVDITGKTVRNLEGTGGTPLVIDRNGLQSGMYFYSIQVQGQKAQGKLLID